MSSSRKYEYENESAIDSKLLCAICFEPFINPKRTSCEHVFCNDCIQLWFTKCVSCPLCRQWLFEKRLKNVTNENMLQGLAQLPVKCSLCQESQIRRKDFEYHLEYQCSKVIVSCSSDNLNCSWKGQREDLQSHRLICSHQSLRKKIDRRMNERRKSNSHRSKIQKLIQQSPFNSHICLRDQQLTDSDIPMILQSAIREKQCQILDLGKNDIPTHGILTLAESLSNNKTLRVLSLHQNSLSEISVLHLAEHLSFPDSALRWLDLESTNLNDTCAEYLAIMLMTNTSLTGLWLSKNQIGYLGVKALTSVLIHQNSTLKYLDLENNPSIDDFSVDCLLEMIKRNQSLKTVYVNNCQLSMGRKAELREIANRKLSFRLFL